MKFGGSFSSLGSRVQNVIMICSDLTFLFYDV